MTIGGQAVATLSETPRGEGETSSLVYAADKSAEHLISGCFAGRKRQLQAWSGGFSPFRKYLPKMAYFQRTGSCRVWVRALRQWLSSPCSVSLSALSIFASAVTIWASATVQEEQIGDADHQQEQRRDTGLDDAVNVVNILKPTRRVPMTRFSTTVSPTRLGGSRTGVSPITRELPRRQSRPRDRAWHRRVGSRSAPPSG
ncbi:hypothetical protein Rleg5DRAFT_1588 [Rhizobium leguminosarum bv. viciae WSM1455]|nr:hypothetical protein Rleg5DRAFT_1588 [Rhizobium leguminosarum bv. viciae WSM1455]